MLPTLEQYEEFVYTLVDRFACIEKSTLVVIRAGAHFAEVAGEVTFGDGCIVLVVRETIDFAEGSIQRYSYEVRERGDTVYWYDSQPHPTDPALTATHPHHKHVPPEVKHNRQPAPDLSFDKLNLSFLIQEIQQRLAHAADD